MRLMLILFALSMVLLPFIVDVEAGNPDLRARAIERDVITHCWDNYSDKSLRYEEKESIKRVCEELEHEYFKRWQTKN